MAIQQTKKDSYLEKRLKILRQQVYGKSVSQRISEPADQNNLTHQYSDIPIHQTTDTLRPKDNQTLAGTYRPADISYLYQDLFKISLLAGLALGLQIILFYLSKNHILNLNFF